eukprot:4793110-Prymnesium_polylepis.1
MRFACDGTFRLWNVPLPGLLLCKVAAPPDAVALYAPALVGAFELSTAWAELFECSAAHSNCARAAACSPLTREGCLRWRSLNSYLISRAKSRLAPL